MFPRSSIIAAILVAAQSSQASADPVTVTDVTGREVTVDAPADRIILGEGRQIYLLGVLERDAPFKRVVGWREDLLQADPDTYALSPRNSPNSRTCPPLAASRMAPSTSNRPQHLILMSCS